ncbi:hypothetical protein J6590_098175, partial [Homalodisca vitripennis]
MSCTVTIGRRSTLVGIYYHSHELISNQAVKSILDGVTPYRLTRVAEVGKEQTKNNCPTEPLKAAE